MSSSRRAGRPGRAPMSGTSGSRTRRLVRAASGTGRLWQGCVGPVVKEWLEAIAEPEPVADRLDRPGIRFGRLDVLVCVALLHRCDQLIVLELRDAPQTLLVVGQLHPEAAARDLIEQGPVVVERGVDVECDPRHRGYRTK